MTTIETENGKKQLLWRYTHTLEDIPQDIIDMIHRRIDSGRPLTKRDFNKIPPHLQRYWFCLK